MLLALPWGFPWALLLALFSSISPALAPDTVARQYTAQSFRRQDALGHVLAHFLTCTFLFPPFPPFFRTKETKATQGDCRIIRTRRRCQIWCCCFLSGSNYCSSGTLCARSGHTLVFQYVMRRITGVSLPAKLPVAQSNPIITPVWG